MNKKKIDIEKVASELREGSVFFRPPTEEAPEHAAEAVGDPATPRQPDVVTSGPTGVTTSRRRLAAPAPPADPVAVLGRAVQELGTKRTTIRFSRPEKAALREIVHRYDRRELRTSENELTRIAVNWLVEDYRELGEDSVLARVVAQLQERPAGE